jgi:hypothetical protein
MTAASSPPIVSIVLDQTVGLPGRHAHAEQGIPHGVGWDVHEVTARPIAWEITAAISACVSTSGPVRV